jgi:hypothetical protein
MNSHEWFVEQRVFFATKTIDPEDERVFADHLARCPECQVEVRQIERELGWLPMGLKPAKPRPGFRWQVAKAVLGARRPSRLLIWIPLAIAAGLGVVVLGVDRRAGVREAELVARQAATAQQLAALSDTVAMLRRAATILQASIEMEGHRGGMVIFADSVTHKWSVVVHGLPPAPAGEKYQFWFVCSDGMVRSVEIAPIRGQPTFVTLEMPGRGGSVLGAALSMEPATNQSDTPKGKELAHVTL